MQILCVGEIIWDIFPESNAEFLGGAPLNVAMGCARLGEQVRLLSAVGADERGQRSLEALRAAGVQAELVSTTREAPTGTATVRHEADGSVHFHIERPAAYDFASADASVLAKPQQLDWIYYGTLAQAGPRGTAPLAQELQAFPGARRFYDVNLRTGHWSLALVEELSYMATAAKVNEDEAETLFRLVAPLAPFSLESFCRLWADRFELELLCITRGADGSLLFENGQAHSYPAYPVQVVDTVGAGDAWVAALLHGMGRGWPLPQAASFANALAAVVAARAGATPAWTLEDCAALMGKLPG